MAWGTAPPHVRARRRGSGSARAPPQSRSAAGRRPVPGQRYGRPAARQAWPARPAGRGAPVSGRGGAPRGARPPRPAVAELAWAGLLAGSRHCGRMAAADGATLGPASGQDRHRAFRWCVTAHRRLADPAAGDRRDPGRPSRSQLRSGNPGGSRPRTGPAALAGLQRREGWTCWTRSTPRTLRQRRRTAGSAPGCGTPDMSWPGSPPA